MAVSVTPPQIRKEGLYDKIIRQLRDDPFSWSIIIFITLFFTVFMILPLFQILINAFYVRGEFRFSTFSAIFSDKFFFDPTASRSQYIIRFDYDSDPNVLLVRGPDLGVFLNTVVIGIFTTFLSLVVGTLTALIMARVDFPGKALLGGLLLIPLVLPPFVGGIGYWALMGNEGILNKHFLGPYLGVKIVFEGMVAIIFVQVLHYFTLIYLNVYSSLMNNDPSLEESAENLGASRFTILRTVTLPLAMPGLASGSILVLILSMEDLGTPIIFAGFGDTVAKKTMTYYILKHIFEGQETSNIAQESAILSTFLLVFAVIGFFAIRKYVALKQYSMVSKGRAGEFRLIPTGILGKIILFFYFFFLLVISLIPHIGVILASTVKSGTYPFEYSLANFSKIFDVQTGFGVFVKNTLVFSLTATFVIIILASLAGYVANRKKFFGQTAFDTLVTLPIAIPGIVLGLGFIRQFSGMGSIRLSESFYLTLNPLIYPPIILVLSYTVRKFPFTVRAVYAGLQQTDVILEEAGENLGASKVRIVVGIILPIIALNIVAGALIALVYNMSEVSTSLILISSPNYGTITWKMGDETGKIGELAAMGVFLMVLQAISLIVTNFLLKDRAEAITGL